MFVLPVRPSAHAVRNNSCWELAFGRRMEGKRTPEWFFKHVIWTDICCDLQPLSQKKAQLQTW